MPKKTYFLDLDKTETLVIVWKGFYNNCIVQINETEILHFANKKAIKEGGMYKIDENREISIQLSKEKLTGIENLQILINGEPIKGSSADPLEIVKGVWSLLFVLSGLNLLIGLTAKFFSIKILFDMDLGFGNVFIGVIYGLLGYLVKVKYSLIALILAILLLAADMIYCIIYVNTNLYASIMIRLFFIFMLLRGIKAIKKIKEHDIKG